MVGQVCVERLMSTHPGTMQIAALKNEGVSELRMALAVIGEVMVSPVHEYVLATTSPVPRGRKLHEEISSLGTRTRPHDRLLYIVCRQVSSRRNATSCAYMADRLRHARALGQKLQLRALLVSSL
jgi:hypothetical protein